MTAFDEDLASLRRSADRIGQALTAIGFRAITDPRVLAISDRLQREVRQARAVGQLTLLAAAAKVRPPAPRSAPPAETPVSPAPMAPTAIPGYDGLSAAQIVPLLGALSDEERDAVLSYEEATRRRSTVIAALRRSA